MNCGTPPTPRQAANRFPELWHSTQLGSSCCPQSHSQQLLGNYFVQKCIWSDVITCNISLLFIKHYETDRSLDFWWKHILTGRGRNDLGELLIGTMCLQCRQLQCYQCLILLPVLYYFNLVLVGTLLFALATASQQAAVVGR